MILWTNMTYSVSMTQYYSKSTSGQAALASIKDSNRHTMKSSVHVTTHVRFCISKYICILQYICNLKCICIAKTQKQTMLHCHNVIMDNFWKYSLKEHLNFCHQTFLSFWIETKFPGPLCCYLWSKSLRLFWTVLSPKFEWMPVLQDFSKTGLTKCYYICVCAAFGHQLSSSR